ncbi:MAG: amidase [Actinobacteria bacterium]|nr:amidase [Actinomycetota bacterium]
MTSSPQDLGLIDQAAAIAAGALTPEELFAAASRRAAAVHRETNAVSAVFEGDLSAQLEAARRGPLFGVPCGVKDMFAIDWRVPEDGTPLPAHTGGSGEADAVTALRRAGALPLLATNLHQLGIGTTSHITALGPIRNPWDLHRCAGGSSGGSAVAVAARVVAGAVGTDAAGSIRIPASYCGIVGLKPTWGTVPVGGYTGSYSSMGVVGPMARDARDCRALAAALLGVDLRVERRERLRIGLPRASHWTDVDPGVRARCESAVDIFAAASAEVSETEIPGAGHLALAAMVTTGTERLPQLDRRWMVTVLPRLHPSVRAIIKTRFDLSANLLQRVLRFRSLLRHALAGAFRHVDVIAMPTAPASPPLVDRPRAELPSGSASADAAALHFSSLANLTGIPAISIPCGLDAAGLPVGISLHAAWGREDLLLDLAEQFERLTDGSYLAPANLAARFPERTTR